MPPQSTITGEVLDQARAYLAAGLSVLPIRLDGTKAPALPKGHQLFVRRATEKDLIGWFAPSRAGGPLGIAIAGGKVSGNLECLDFEKLSIFKAWAAIVDEQDPGLTERLNVCKTPGRYGEPGVHVRYRCEDPVPGSTKLASETISGKTVCVIETRGEGGYAVAPGSPAAVHESGKEYEYATGPDLTSLAVISAAEREILIATARALNSVVQESDAKADSERIPGGRLMPGTDFSLRGPDWAEILTPHGWTECRANGFDAGGIRFWRRPGKGKGWSATTGHCKGNDGADLFYVFTSNASPFESLRCYSKFRTWAILNHKGNLTDAARELGKKGFGEQKKPGAATAKAANGQADGHANGHGGKEVNGKAKDGHGGEDKPAPWQPPIPLNEIPPADEFPLAVLPMPLSRFVEEIAWATNTPIDFAGVCLLVVAGAAIGNSRWLSITRTYSLPPMIWAAIVGLPGSRKSPVISMIKAPLEQLERRYYKSFKGKMTEWEIEGDGDKPVLRRGLVDDFTIEDLARLLSDNPRGVAVVKDELAGLVSALNQYKSGGKGNDRQVMLNIWSAGSIRVDRKSNQGIPIVVHRPFAGIIGAIQPDVVEFLRGEAEKFGAPVADGFIDRFLPSYPNPLPAMKELWREVSIESSDKWQEVVEKLAGIEMHEETDGYLRPHYVPLAISARDRWEAFTQIQADEINAGELPRYLEGTWPKLTGVCGRLALVIHCLREACGEDVGGQVDGWSIDCGAELVKYFKSHIRRTAAAMDLNPQVADAKRILSWLEKHGRTTFKGRDLVTNMTTRFPTIESISGPIDVLEKHGFIRPTGDEAGDSHRGRGRPPAASFEVNPLPCERKSEGGFLLES